MTIQRAYRYFPALAALFTFCTFLPALQNDWVNWDDTANFLENHAYRGLGFAQLKWMWGAQPDADWADHYIPLSWMTLGLDYKLWGMNPFGYHLTNVLIHTANAVLVYLLAVAIFEITIPSASRSGIALGALFGALVFGVHPLRVESVAWITERRDVLSGLFWLLAVLAYLRAYDPRRAVRRGYYWASFVCFVLAILSKEIALTLPAVLLILDVYPLRRWLQPPVCVGQASGLSLGKPEACATESTAGIRRVWLDKIPFAAAGLALLLVMMRVSRVKDHFDALAGLGWLARISAAVYNLAFYLWKTLAPVGLSPFYPFTPHKIDPMAAPFAISLMAVLSITAAAVLLRHRSPALAAAWLAYAVILSPVLGLIPSGPRLSNDRNTYSACIAWALLAGAGMAVWWNHSRTARWLVPALAAAVTVSLAIVTQRQISVWRDSDTLWTRALAVEPSFIAYTNMADVLISRGDNLWAAEHFRKAIAMRPDFSPAHVGLGGVLLATNRPSEAIHEFQISLDLGKDQAVAQNGIACALALEGKLDEAIQHFDRALQLRPSYEDARRNRAQVEARKTSPARKP